MVRLVALAITTDALVDRTMLKRGMRISNILEVMHLFRLEDKRGCQRMYRRIAPAFEIEAAFPVQVVEVVSVLTTAKEVQIGDFKVGPEMAVVPDVSCGIPAAESGKDVLSDRPRRPGCLEHGLPQCTLVLVSALDKVGGCSKEARYQRSDLVKGDCVAVFLVLSCHIRKRIVGDLAGECHPWLDSPVVLVLG